MALVTSTEVREFIQDFASRNKIFVEREFTDTEISNSITWGLEFSQMIPPYIQSFDPDTMPKYLQLICILYQLFFRAALFNQRNQSQLTEQGIPLTVGENANIYMQTAELLKTQAIEFVGLFKRGQNLGNMVSYQSSPYYSSWMSVDDDGSSYQ